MITRSGPFVKPSHYRSKAINSGGFGGLAPQFATAAEPNINSHLEKKFAAPFGNGLEAHWTHWLEASVTENLPK